MGENDIFSAFMAKWAGPQHRMPSIGKALARLEHELSITLPGSYRRFISAHGTPSTTIALLNSIVEGRHDLHDVSEFIDIDKVADTTAAYENAGMSPGYVGFAEDCMGNMFLFRKTDCHAEVDDISVWFFDHDFVTIEEEAPSFVAWLERFVDVEVVAEV